MPGNPLIQQGNINRLLGSIVFLDNPQLNVTAPFLAKQAISIAFENDAGLLIPTMTGAVTSPDPYQLANVSVHLIRAQSFADQWKQQMELDVDVGDFTVIPDATTLSEYILVNGIIKGIREISFDGTQAEFLVTLAGIYYLNSALWVN